jgi:hypothetical protein
MSVPNFLYSQFLWQLIKRNQQHFIQKTLNYECAKFLIFPVSLTAYKTSLHFIKVREYLGSHGGDKTFSFWDVILLSRLQI